MILEERLYAFVSNADNYPIPAIVQVDSEKQTVDVRFYWESKPGESEPEGGEPPYIVATIVSEPPIATHDQPLSGFRHWQLQFSCFAKDYLDARVVANQLITALVGFREPSPGIKAVLKRNQLTLWDDDSKFNNVVVELDVMEDLR